MARNMASDFLGNVRVVSDANVTISGLNNGDTIDSVVVATGNLVLLSAQTTGTENGVYLIGATAGSTIRQKDFFSSGDFFTGGLLRVTEGTVYADTTWQFGNTGSFNLGNDTPTFTQIETDLGALETLLTTLSGTVGTVDAAAPTTAAMAGVKAVDGVPTEMDDGDLGNLVSTLHQMLLVAGYDFGTGALQNTPVSEAARNTQETPMSVLTTATPTAAVNVENYSEHSIHFTVAGFNTSMSLNVQASLDGTTYSPMSVEDDPTDDISLMAVANEVITITGNGEFPIRFKGALHSVKLDLVAFGAGTPTITPTYRGGR